MDKGIWHICCNYDFCKDSWLGRCVSSVTQGSWCIYISQWQHYDWGWECTQHLYWLLPFPHSVFFLCLTAISSPTGPQTFPLKVARLITPLIRLYFTQIWTQPPTPLVLLSLFLRSAAVYHIFHHCPRLLFFRLNYWYQTGIFCVKSHWTKVTQGNKPADKDDLSVLSGEKNRG